MAPLITRTASLPAAPCRRRIQCGTAVRSLAFGARTALPVGRQLRSTATGQSATLARTVQFGSVASAGARGCPAPAAQLPPSGQTGIRRGRAPPLPALSAAVHRAPAGVASTRPAAGGRKQRAFVATMRARALAVFAALSLGATLIVASARADEPDPCVRALAQLKILKLTVRVYKEGPGGSRTYLSDHERPSEVDRLQQLATEACGDSDELRRQQDTDANRLVIALGPRCATYRDELEMLQRPGSRATEQDIDRRRSFVAAYCPDMSRADTWLPDRVIVGRPD
jgi:hypothetical protein